MSKIPPENLRFNCLYPAIQTSCGFNGIDFAVRKFNELTGKEIPEIINQFFVKIDLAKVKVYTSSSELISGRVIGFSSSNLNDKLVLNIGIETKDRKIHEIQIASQDSIPSIEIHGNLWILSKNNSKELEEQLIFEII